MSPVGAALAVVLATLPAPTPGDSPSRARAALSKETGALDRIDALDRLISQLAIQQFEMEEKLTAQEARARGLRENTGLLAQSLTDRRTLVQQRLRARARLDEAAYLRILFAAHDATEVVHRRTYLRRVLENDARLLRDLRQARETLDGLTAEQAEVVAAIVQAKSALSRQRERLEVERRTRTSMLDALRHERDALRRLISQQDAAQASLVFDGTAAPDAIGFAAEQGRLPTPTPGAVARGFGRVEDPELGTAIFRKGIEIDALLGAPVRAVFTGRVAFAGWYRGFGNLVILAHGEGYHTLYAHLATIAPVVGDTVAGGDVVGAVGDTGSLRGPILYFEIRLQKRSLDPAEWLAKRR